MTEINNNPEQNGDAKLLDGLTEEWKNLAVEDLVRGATLDDIDQRCFELCQTYLGGSWANAKSKADVTVKRISGGFTNQLYHAHLNESVKRVPNPIYPDEPSDVAIKIYQEKHIKNYNLEDNERLNDIIILTIMSQVGLGPKVYGIFNDGFIQGYYKHEQFRAKHQEDPKMVKQLLTLLARINHLNVPISKKPNLLFNEMGKMLEFAYKNCRVEEISKELELKELSQRDLREEFKELMSIVDSLNAPTVFCHVDFRGSNLLVTEPDQKILACDLEYCEYGCRGFDLASIFSEWGKKDLTDMSNKVPDDDELGRLIQIYIDAVDKVIPGYSKKPENSLAAHVKETKVMVLVNGMFFLSLMAKQQDSVVPAIPFDPKQQMQFVNFILKAYYDYKDQLIKDGTIKI